MLRTQWSLPVGGEERPGTGPTARPEGDKRALEPLLQSVDRVGWANQHVGSLAGGRKQGREAEAEPLAAVDQGEEPETETEP